MALNGKRLRAVPGGEASTAPNAADDRNDAAAAAADGAPLVQLRDAGVSYGAVRALAPLDFDVRRGEVIALVGANGSGKTTLLRVLHGVVAHEGTRRIGVAALRQAMVFQRPFLLRLSVWNNLRVALWLAERTTPAEERHARAGEALARVGLDALAARPARALSGGEQQRLALARAWALDPAVLFLDEPTASLDPAATRAVERIVGEIHARGTTIVMSTHNLAQAKRLADDVVFVHQGRIAERASAADFFRQPASAEARDFIEGERL
jgi:tungstate transport system ATP-binding protein